MQNFHINKAATSLTVFNDDEEPCIQRLEIIAKADNLFTLKIFIRAETVELKDKALKAGFANTIHSTECMFNQPILVIHKGFNYAHQIDALPLKALAEINRHFPQLDLSRIFNLENRQTRSIFANSATTSSAETTSDHSVAPNTPTSKRW